MSSAYSMLVEHGGGQDNGQQQQKLFGRVWKTFAHVKAQAMAWKLLWNRLPTINNLHKRFGIPNVDRVCCCCKLEEESAKHLFLGCRSFECVVQDGGMGRSFVGCTKFDRHPFRFVLGVTWRRNF